MKQQIEFDKLCLDSWRTSSARFNAYRHFKTKNTLSIITVSMLSILNISMSLDIFTHDTDSVAIIVSIFILALSLLEFAKDYSVKAERFHSNAIEISHFNKCLRAQNNVDELSSLLDEYHNLKQKCPENHEPIDDDLFCLKHPRDFTHAYACGFRAKTLIKHIFRTYALYAILLATTAFIAFLPLCN